MNTSLISRFVLGLKICVICLCMSFAAGATAQAPVKILFLGDSIGYGYGIADKSKTWIPLAQQQLARNPLTQTWTIINASISGDRARDSEKRLKTLIKTHNPKIIVIELGGNDALRGASIKDITQSLTKLILLAKNQTPHVMLAQISLPPNFGRRHIARFENMFLDLAHKYQARVLPLKNLKDKAGGPEMLQPDRIHPTAASQKLLAKMLVDGIFDFQPSITGP